MKQAIQGIFVSYKVWYLLCKLSRESNLEKSYAPGDVGIDLTPKSGSLRGITLQCYGAQSAPPPSFRNASLILPYSSTESTVETCFQQAFRRHCYFSISHVAQIKKGIHILCM